MAKKFRLGAVIASLKKDSPAAKAGLKKGDVIVGIRYSNRTQGVSESSDIWRILKKCKPGRRMFIVMRTPASFGKKKKARRLNIEVRIKRTKDGKSILGATFVNTSDTNKVKDAKLAKKVVPKQDSPFWKEAADELEEAMKFADDMAAASEKKRARVIKRALERQLDSWRFKPSKKTSKVRKIAIWTTVIVVSLINLAAVTALILY